MNAELALFAESLGVSPETFVFIVVIISVWELVWNGLALWRAGRNGDKWWFIIMLLVNDLGILEILYYFIFSKKKGTVTDTQA